MDIYVYIPCYLEATALLLNVLERQKSQQSTRLLIYIIYYYIGSSPNLSSIVCVSTYFQNCSCPASGPLFPQFPIQFRYHVVHSVLWFLRQYHSAR